MDLPLSMRVMRPEIDYEYDKSTNIHSHGISTLYQINHIDTPSDNNYVKYLYKQGVKRVHLYTRKASICQQIVVERAFVYKVWCCHESSDIGQISTK